MQSKKRGHNDYQDQTTHEDGSNSPHPPKRPHEEEVPNKNYSVGRDIREAHRNDAHKNDRRNTLAPDLSVREADAPPPAGIIMSELGEIEQNLWRAFRAEGFGSQFTEGSSLPLPLPMSTK